MGLAVPLTIEWDNDVPDWPILQAEAARADAEGHAAARRELADVV